MSSSIIPVDLQRFLHPVLDEKHIEALRSQAGADISIYDNSGIYEKLESKLKRLFDIKSVLTTNSGTNALFSLFYGAGIGPNDEVLVPSYTFFATVTPLLWLGPALRFLDAGPDGNVDPIEIVRKGSERTKAIVITHMWGVPCDMAAIERARDAVCPNALILEDVSHAHMATWNGAILGSFSDGAAWSLQGKKLLTAGEGGFLTLREKRNMERAVLLGHFNRRAKLEVANADLIPFATTGVGFNLRMHPFGAALAATFADELEQQVQERRESVQLFSELIASIHGLRVVRGATEGNPSWYAIPIAFDRSSFSVGLDDFVAALHDLGGVDADVPRSTGPLVDHPLFHRAAHAIPAYSGREKAIDASEGSFAGARRFQEGMFKLQSWYGPRRYDYAQAYAKAVRTVAESVSRV